MEMWISNLLNKTFDPGITHWLYVRNQSITAVSDSAVTKLWDGDIREKC